MNNIKLIEINDVYFISKLIKKINKNFRLFFNPTFNRYEIHNIKDRPSFVISSENYPTELTITKLFKTNKDNMANLFKEIDEHNKRLEDNQEKNLLDNTKNQFTEIMSYIQKTPSISFDKLNLKNILEKED